MPLNELSSQKTCPLKKIKDLKANAMKFLQACIFKSVQTGLFKSLVAISVAKFKMFMIVFTFKNMADKHKHIEFDNTCGYN